MYKYLLFLAFFLITSNYVLFCQENDTLATSNLLEQITLLKAENARLQQEIQTLKMEIEELTQKLNLQTNSTPAIQPSDDKDYGQCKAITKSGNRCKRKAGASGYCWQHEK